MKSIDVVIPTYRPGKEFTELLRRIDVQSVKADHLILINTGRDAWEKAEFDHTLVQNGTLPCGTKVIIEHIQPEEFDHGGSRQRAASRSEADILLFMTQDALPKNERLLQHMAEAFLVNGEKTAAVYARQLPREDCAYLETYTRKFNYGDRSFVKSEKDLPRLGIKTFFCSNVCAAYDRGIFEKLGGFEEPTIFNEDMIFAAKLIFAGYQIAYAAEAEVIHSHNYSGLQQFQRNFDLAVSQAEHPEIFEKVSSEKEGKKLVKETALHLLKVRRPFTILTLVWMSGWKYLGYFVGKRYRRLPKSLVLKCTMSPHAKFWKLYFEKTKKSV
ncbi:MAG: glycosyltransferase [Eubacteriales bacterium]|nr:glycosyltransferase [Eubacteriales bacterium]